MLHNRPKNISFLFILLMMCVAACSSDDDNSYNEENNNTEELIIGKWLFDNTEQEFPSNNCEGKSFLVFDNEGSAGAVIYNAAGEECTPLIVTSYHYEFISDDTIKFILLNDNGEEDPNDTFNSKVLSISESELVLKDVAFMQGEVSFVKGME